MKKKRTKKINETEILILILNMKMAGQLKPIIAKHVKEKYLFQDDKTAYGFIRKAEKLLSESVAIDDVKELVKESAMKINLVYQQALKSEQFQVALNCLTEINKLFGLYPDKQMVVKKIDENTISMSVIEERLKDIQISDMNEVVSA